MIRVDINGQKRSIPDRSTVRSLLEDLGIADRQGYGCGSQYGSRPPHSAHVPPCCRLAIVWKLSRPLVVDRRRGMKQFEDPLVIGGKEFQSRLIVGTGKYPTLELMQECHEASGADMVTVAVRRMELPGTGKTLLDYIDRDRFTILPNTAGCYDADVGHFNATAGAGSRVVRLYQAGSPGRQKTLFPDVEELLKATRVLAKEGFIVMPYTNDDPIIGQETRRRWRRSGHAAGSTHWFGPGDL